MTGDRSKAGCVGRRSADPQIGDQGCREALRCIAEEHQRSGLLAQSAQHVRRARVAASGAVDVDTEGARNDHSEVDAPEEVGENDGCGVVHSSKCRTDTIADPEATRGKR